MLYLKAVIYITLFFRLCVEWRILILYPWYLYFIVTHKLVRTLKSVIWSFKYIFLNRLLIPFKSNFFSFPCAQRALIELPTTLSISCIKKKNYLWRCDYRDEPAPTTFDIVYSACQIPCIFNVIWVQSKHICGDTSSNTEPH